MEEDGKKCKPSAPSSGNSRKTFCVTVVLCSLKWQRMRNVNVDKTLEEKLTVKDVLGVT